MYSPNVRLGYTNYVVMAKPSRKAWKSAMYMIAWMRANRTRGIQFSTKGNDDPIVFSDASFNPDPNDGLSQYGWVTMWKGVTVL